MWCSIPPASEAAGNSRRTDVSMRFSAGPLHSASTVRYIVALLVVVVGIPLRSMELWVSPDGDDHNPGTRAAPFRSPAAAQRRARDLRRVSGPAPEGGIRVALRGGIYTLNSPLFFRPEDSGTAANPTLFESAPGETAILSGGISVGGWSCPAELLPGLPAVTQGKLWVAAAPRWNGRNLEFRQLWIDGRKAARAQSPEPGKLDRLVQWDREREEAWIPSATLRSVHDPLGLEFTVHQQWEIATLRVKSVRVEGDRACLTFQSPESKLEFEHPWPQPVMNGVNGNAAFFLTGPPALLDRPGEWAILPDSRIVYWPRPDEELTHAHVVVPTLETLLDISGTLDRRVEHVSFRGIQFVNTTWLRPSKLGHVPLQAAMPMIDAYKLSPKGTPDAKKLDNQAWTERAAAAVRVRSGANIIFERCAFEHLASAGLDCDDGTSDCLVEGCRFRDIGGNAMQLGNFAGGGLEAHVPYSPRDTREICARLRIANNRVTNCANEDWGGVGIGVGYAREITIEHNELSDLSYTGISVGWGWTRLPSALGQNIIRANLVHHVATRMGDTAGIYLLSAQPGTVVAENYIHDITMGPYVHDPEHWFYLYLDEGSSYITVRDNACPAERFLKNSNGPGNTWTHNGPDVAESVRAAAGLEPAFRDLLDRD